jgi:hypothetical protein
MENNMKLVFRLLCAGALVVGCVIDYIAHDTHSEYSLWLLGLEGVLVALIVVIALVDWYKHR